MFLKFYQKEKKIHIIFAQFSKKYFPKYSQDLPKSISLNYPKTSPFLNEELDRTTNLKKILQ